MPRKKTTTKQMAKKTTKKEVKNKSSEKIIAERNTSKGAQKTSKKRRKSSFQTARGMRDILPQDQRYWQWIEDTCVNIAENYGFKRLHTPAIEHAELFKRSIGAGTDIVEKEMFAFEDLGGDKLALRPEFTASICRAYAEHGMFNLPQPVKVYEYGSCYRYERPQSGRHREFRQFDMEVIGSGGPVVDAEIIIISYLIYKELGLDITIQINSLGTEESRVVYRKVLLDYFKRFKKDLCQDCISRMKKNPLRLLDCKEEKCVKISEEAPQILDHLDEESRDHFTKVLEYLDEFDLPYMLNPRIVRGLDYYIRTTFEFWHGSEEEGRTTALGGGGRYDPLIELVGGRPAPGAGVALGIDRMVSKLREKNIQPPETFKYDVYLAQIGDLARKRSMILFEELRTCGFRVMQNISKNGLRPQFELADKSGVKYTLVIGQKEISDGTILLRDMESGMQETLNIEKVEKELRKRLGK